MSVFYKDRDPEPVEELKLKPHLNLTLEQMVREDGNTTLTPLKGQVTGAELDPIMTLTLTEYKWPWSVLWTLKEQIFSVPGIITMEQDVPHLTTHIYGSAEACRIVLQGLHRALDTKTYQAHRLAEKGGKM
jgi:hypothetical protein